MNIFYLDDDPQKAAQMMCDKHVVKMCLESAQILCSVIGKITEEFDVEKPPYRITHRNHPCVVWTGQSPQNFDWLYQHSIALCEEYTFRYEKRHASQDVIEWCGKNKVTNLLSSFTCPPQAMPDEYRKENVVTAYRDYYFYDKRKNIKCEWKKGRPAPDWWNRMLALEQLTEQAQELDMGY